MKALVVNAAGRSFDLEEVDVAAPIGREVLIDVQASGLCHTDLLFAANNIAPFPAVFGHEVSGVVAQIGPDVTQFRVGDSGAATDGTKRLRYFAGDDVKHLVEARRKLGDEEYENYMRAQFA